jgi:hypothetical protein
VEIGGDNTPALMAPAGVPGTPMVVPMMALAPRAVGRLAIGSGDWTGIVLVVLKCLS